MEKTPEKYQKNQLGKKYQKNTKRFIMNLFKNTLHLNTRYKKQEETLRTLLLRPIFYPMKHFRSSLKVVDEDWKYLIVLDACRYDIFKKVNTIPGNLSKKYSAGTHTVEWLKNNFMEKHEDIAYISANPQVSFSKLEKSNVKKSQNYYQKLYEVSS